MLEKMLTCENQRDSAKRGWERRTANGGLRMVDGSIENDVIISRNIFASLLEICWKSSERVENCLSVLNFILRTLKYLILRLSMHANFPSFFRLISSSNPEDISTYGDLVLNNSSLMFSLFSTVRHPLSSFDKLVNGLPVLITLFQMFFYFSLLELRFSHWQKAFFK